MSIELPEVETLRRDLEREVVGKKVKSVELASMAMAARYRTRKAFTGALEGRKITGAKRVGTVLVFETDSDEVLVVRLGPATRLLKAQPKDASEAGTEVVVTFTQGGQLRIVDPGDDEHGEVLLVPPDELADAVPEVKELGMDPIDEPISWTRFGEMLVARPTKLKTLLMDPSFVVGIGDVYSDEILFNAGLRHDRMSDSLSTQEIRRLYRAMVEIVHDAVKYRGTSSREGGWVDLYGRPGEFDVHLSVYGREGELSPRSRTPIKKAKFNGRWTYYCDTQM